MKRFVPYPLLLTTAIVLDRVLGSVTEIDATQSIQPLFVLLGSTFIFALLVQCFVKDWRRTDFMVFLAMIMLIMYGVLYDFFKAIFPTHADVVGLLLIPLLTLLYFPMISKRIWKALRNPAQLDTYFYLVFSLLLIFQVVHLAALLKDNLLHSRYESTSSAIAPLSTPIHLRPNSQPDIYVIVLDGYGRKDVLQKIYDYDNSPFLNALQQRGFYVATDNHSNYIETPFAMAALWNFDYLTPWNLSGNYTEYRTDPIENNRVFHLLKEAGYTTVSFDGSADYTQIKTADVFLSDFVPISRFDSFLLAGSPLEPISDVFGLRLPIPNSTTHRLRAQYKFNKIQEIPTLIPGPKITYMHILVPHPPFIFDENGNPVDPPRAYSLADANEFQGSREEYWKGYRAQVIFVNGKVLEAVDAILKKSKQPPIILIMSDHGPGSMFNYDVKKPGCVWERTRNLYAIYLPGHQADNMLYPSISPVNTFRVIFDTYFGTDLPLLEDRSYFMAWQYPTAVMDLTSMRDSVNGCTFQTDPGDNFLLRNQLPAARDQN